MKDWCFISARERAATVTLSSSRVIRGFDGFIFVVGAGLEEPFTLSAQGRSRPMVLVLCQLKGGLVRQGFSLLDAARDVLKCDPE